MSIIMATQTLWLPERMSMFMPTKLHLTISGRIYPLGHYHNACVDTFGQANNNAYIDL
jgi:hypothetical protein